MLSIETIRSILTQACALLRHEAAIKEELKREIRQRRENAEIRVAVFRMFGVFRGSVLREILAACEQLRLLQCRERKNLDLKNFAQIASFSRIALRCTQRFRELVRQDLLGPGLSPRPSAVHRKLM